MAAGTQFLTRSSRRRVWIIAVVALVAVVVVLAGIKAGQIGKMIKASKSFAIPPESVTSARVDAQEWQAARSAIGTLVAIRAVTLASEVSGLVREIGFESGTPVASLQSIHPIYGEFWLPQQALAELKIGMTTRLRTDVFPQTSWEGTLTTINPEVDINTRNVRVRATFPNTDGRLRPGMFVNVDVLSPERRTVLVIPSTAVLYAPYGDSVFAIEEKPDAAGKQGLIAHQKFVRLGERRGDLVAVVSGLNSGETIVSSGGFKLRNGAAVVVHNELAPKIEVAPTPVDR